MADDAIAFVPVILIVWAISMITFVAVRGMNWRHGEKQIEARQAERQLASPQQPVPTLDQFQMLEDRMRVLEKIVTDRGYGLADEIDALREGKSGAKQEVR